MDFNISWTVYIKYFFSFKKYECCDSLITLCTLSPFIARQRGLSFLDSGTTISSPQVAVTVLLLQFVVAVRGVVVGTIADGLPLHAVRGLQ
jgi:hypothetical protein